MERAKVKKYRSEDSERVYWSVNDSAAEIDWSKGKRVMRTRLL